MTASECFCQCYQERAGAVSAHDPEANGLVPRFWTVTADVDRSQVDDTFTARNIKIK